MSNLFYNMEWQDFEDQPDEDFHSEYTKMPVLDRNIRIILFELAFTKKAKSIILLLCRLVENLIKKNLAEQYSLLEAQSVFRSAFELVRQNGLILEEYCKRDDVLKMFFMACYDMSYCIDTSQGKPRFDEVHLLIQTLRDRNRVIDKYLAGLMDFRYEYVFLARLMKDSRLKKYFFDALHFYESVPQDELLEDKEANIDNILQAVRCPGWDEFVPCLEKYLRREDDILAVTAMDSLGIIGGEKAVSILKKLRWNAYEGFLTITPYNWAVLEMNLIRAEKGFKGLIEEIKKPGIDIDKARVGIRLLSPYAEPGAIQFLYKLLEDERLQEIEVHYLDEEGCHVEKEISFPLREESFKLLLNYDESYVTSIVGEKFKAKKACFYRDLKKLSQQLKMKNFWENNEYPD